MKYCIKCGSPLEEQSVFCVKCATPVEEDGIFYEEEFYLPKKVLRSNRRQALMETASSSEKKRKTPRIAILLGGLAILVSVCGMIGYKDRIFSTFKVDSNEVKEEISVDNKGDNIKQVEKGGEAETAFNPLGDKTNVDSEIEAEEIENKEKYNYLLKNIEEEANNTFSELSGKYSLVFKDLDNAEGLAIGSGKIEAASIIKLFIMIEVYEEISKGSINPQDVIVLKDYMKAEGSGVIAEYPSGTEFTYEELVAYMMNKSDNTAANILIDKLGFNSLNNRMKALGCKDSELNRRMMDDPAINNGIENYVSMKDLAIVLEKLYKGQCVSSEYDKKMIEIMEANEQRDKLSRDLPGGVKVANKAGEYFNITNDAGIVFTEKGAYILCVAVKGSNIEEQSQAIGDVSKKVYDFYMSYKTNINK